MPAHLASLINALLLVTLGGWGYLASDTPSFTALIPAGIGFLLLVLNPGLRKEDKTAAHIAVLLTLIVLLGLGMPLRGAIGRGDGAAIGRVAVMLLSTIVAMVFFVKSFVDNRKRRKSQTVAK